MPQVSISKTFLLALGVTFAVIVLIAGIFVRDVRRYSIEATRLGENLRDTSQLNQQIRQHLIEQGLLVYRQFDRSDSNSATKFKELNFAIGNLQASYQRLQIDNEERVLVERLKSYQAELNIKSAQIFENLRNDHRPEAIRLLDEVEEIQQRIDTEFANLNQIQLAKLAGVQRQLTQTAATALRAVIAASAGIVLALVVFGLILRTRVILPISEMLEATARIRRGEFGARVGVRRPDEIGQLATELNFMSESLAASYAELEKKVEQRTAQLQELQQQLIREAKMAAVGKLVSGVAHEINNPLAVIMGFTELAKRRLVATGGDPKQIKLMDDLHSQGERCRRIVVNLLQFARQSKPMLELVRLNDLVDHAILLREYELKIQNIEIVRNYDASNPSLCADSNKLQQVVLNLINNSADAISETGHAGVITIQTRDLKDSVVIEVSDTGTGIREVDRVFDPFYTTKEVGQGTGLGLSVCYGIIEEHQGQITAENLEHGARVCITLPKGDVGKLQATPETLVTLPTSTTRREGLIVEDEESMIGLQKTFLDEMGIDAHGVESGEKAILYLREHTPDLIVSDVRMPGSVDGIELFKWVEANRPELASRFIFVSGDLIGLEEDQFFQNCNVPRIQKPFRMDDYSRCIRRIIENRGANK